MGGSCQTSFSANYKTYLQHLEILNTIKFRKGGVTKKMRELRDLASLEAFVSRHSSTLKKMVESSLRLDLVMKKTQELKIPDEKLLSSRNPNAQSGTSLDEALDDLSSHVSTNQRRWSVYNTEATFDVIAMQQAVSALFRQFFEPLEVVPITTKWTKKYGVLRQLQQTVMQEAISTLKMFEDDFNHPLNLLIESRETVMCKIPARWKYWTEFNIFLHENILKLDIEADVCQYEKGSVKRDMRQRVMKESSRYCEAHPNAQTARGKKQKKQKKQKKAQRRLLQSTDSDNTIATQEDECPLLYMGEKSKLSGLSLQGLVDEENGDVNVAQWLLNVNDGSSGVLAPNTLSLGKSVEKSDGHVATFELNDGFTQNCAKEYDFDIAAEYISGGSHTMVNKIYHVSIHLSKKDDGVNKFVEYEIMEKNVDHHNHPNGHSSSNSLLAHQRRRLLGAGKRGKS